MGQINQELLNEFMATSGKLRKLMFQRSNMDTEEKMATILQFQALHQLEKKSGLTVGDLATELMLSSGAIAQLTERLVNNGWLKREDDAKDRRIVHLLLTEQGEKYLLEHKRIFEKEIAIVLKYISERELKVLIMIQSKMLKSLEENQKQNV